MNKNIGTVICFVRKYFALFQAFLSKQSEKFKCNFSKRRYLTNEYSKCYLLVEYKTFSKLIKLNLSQIPKKNVGVETN